jgi:hypothetical protein
MLIVSVLLENVLTGVGWDIHVLLILFATKHVTHLI